MANTKDVPEFGSLTGVKVLSTGSVVAQPFAAELMSEQGATVIHVESTVAPETIRNINYAWETEHRNEICIALNTPSPEGKEIFLKLIEWADIWMESSKGGTYQGWGLTDDVMWQHNPDLVIVHVSGFGQSGLPDYVNRASYDAVGQAFSGYFFVNGLPEPNPPLRANPFTCDYVTSLFVAWSSLAALRKAQATGKGEMIDIAQFEVMAKIMLHYPGFYLNSGIQLQRNGNSDPVSVGYDCFKCGDGNWIFVGFGGGAIFKRGLPLLGLDKDPDFPPGIAMALRGSPAGDKLQKALEDFCMAADAETVEKRFLSATIPCNRVFDFAMAEKDPHFQARGVYTEWDDPKQGHMRGVNVIPKFTKEPGKYWRYAPLYGEDNDDVLAEFGFSKEQIASFYEKGIIKKA